MTCIQLKSRETKFWRHQKDNPATYLSTIEAVHYLVRDYHELFLEDTSYNGEYDNLLFFFSFMYQKIRTFYDGGKDLKAYKQRAKTKQICGEKTSEWAFNIWLLHFFPIVYIKYGFKCFASLCCRLEVYPLCFNDKTLLSNYTTS